MSEQTKNLSSAETLFLEAVSCALRGETVSWTVKRGGASSEEKAEGTEKHQDCSYSIFPEVFALADRHLMLPMVYEAVYPSEAFGSLSRQELSAEQLRQFKKKAIRQVVLQYEREACFLRLYEFLQSRGLEPAVLKGLICRNVYPLPQHRQSWDEDILVRDEEFDRYHEALLAFGMQLRTPEEQLKTAYEVIYYHPEGHLTVEVHRSLFPEGSPQYGGYNRFFAAAQERTVSVPYEGLNIRTMDPSDHLFYLICHTMKHFLHYGAGLRQITDILMFAKVYTSQIDWDALEENCRQIRADVFLAAVFQIGRDYLGFAPETFCPVKSLIQTDIDIRPLLRDILDTGMQGQTTAGRIHSSNMTLHAAASTTGNPGEEGGKGRLSTGNRKSGGSAILHSVFLPLGSMRGRYPFLNKAPFLLPVAWGMRIASYLGETSRLRKKADHQNPNSQKAEEGMLEAVRIGKERIRLLEMYHIIE